MGLTMQLARQSAGRSRRDLIAVVVLLGLLGGVSLLTLAGARRTQSSYPRFLRASNASTMAVDPGQYDAATDKAIASLPQVARSASYVAFTVGPLIDGKPDFDADWETVGTFDGRFFTMDRFAPTEGRLANPDEVDEVVINQALADSYHYRIGTKIDLGLYSDEQASSDSFFDSPPPPKIRTLATVVGIGLFTDEVVQDDTNVLPLMLVTPAYSRQAKPYAGYAWQGLILKRGDADVDAVKTAYMANVPPGTPQFFRVTSVDTFHAQQAVRPLSLALAAFGLIAGAAALVLVGQAVGRGLRRGQQDQDVLRSFGTPPRALVAAAVAGPTGALALGAILASVIAFLGSPIMPIGAPRRVEVARGFDIDWTVLGLGAVVLFLPLAVLAVISAVRQLPHLRSADRRLPRRSRAVGAAARAGLPPSVVAGARLAFEPGEGTTAVPVRSVMVAAAVAVATLVAALSFGASYRSLLDTPRLYGWNWDLTLFDSSGYGAIDVAKVHRLLDHQPDVAAWSGGYFGADSIDGLNLPLLGMEPRSTVAPPLLKGRMIANGNEVVLGTATAHDLDKDVGDVVRIGVGRDRHPLQVVGLSTFPSIGIAHGAHTSLGVGALVTPGLVPGVARNTTSGTFAGSSGPTVPMPVVFVRYRTGADPAKALARIKRGGSAIGEYPGSVEFLGPQRPAEIANSSEVGGVPALLAAALGLSAALSLAFAVASSVRRRRRELALLNSLGFTRGQLAASVAWQATATIGVGLLAGVPLGIALGRTLWIAFARQLDVLPRPVTPVLSLVGVVVAGLVIANLAAALPARRARLVHAAEALRAE